MQYTEFAHWISIGKYFQMNYNVGIDGISLWLVLLTTFIMPIAVLSTWKAVEKNTKGFMALLLLLETAMLGAFVSLDLFLFYIFWELMLIPMYFLIGIWGGKNRIYAAVKFFIFTAVGSLLMLVAIIFLYYHAVQAGIARQRLQHHRLLQDEPHTGAADLALPRLRLQLRHQGADVPAAHLAARRPHRGADRRLGHSGRHPAEDGHLRLRALRHAAVP